MTRYFGYRKETTFGVENTSNPITYVEVNKCTLDPPSDATIDVDTIEETKTRNKKGFYSPAGDVEIALDIPTMIDWLYFTFGVEVDTGTVAEGITTEIYPSGSRKLPSFTAYVGKDDGNENDYEYICYGCVVSKLALSLSDGIAIATMTIQAQKDGKAPLKDDSEIIFNDTYPIAFYEARTYMGLSELSARTKSFDFEFDNGVTASNGQAFNSMHPYRLNSNGKTPTVKTTVEYEGDDMLIKFWGSANGPVCNTTYETYSITFEDEQENKLSLFFPRFALKNAPAPIEGSDGIKQDLELDIMKARTNLADETAIRTSCLATIEIPAVEP